MNLEVHDPTHSHAINLGVYQGGRNPRAYLHTSDTCAPTVRSSSI